MSKMIKKLLHLDPPEREDALENYVVELFKYHLKMGENDVLVLDSSFFEQGLTSLAAMEIKQTLEYDLNCVIDSTLVFNFPTVHQIIQQIIRDSLAELFQSQCADINNLNPCDVQNKKVFKSVEQLECQLEISEAGSLKAEETDQQVTDDKQLLEKEYFNKLIMRDFDI